MAKRAKKYKPFSLVDRVTNYEREYTILSDALDALAGMGQHGADLYDAKTGIKIASLAQQPKMRFDESAMDVHKRYIAAVQLFIPGELVPSGLNVRLKNPGLVAALLEGAAGAIGGAVAERMITGKEKNPGKWIWRDLTSGFERVTDAWGILHNVTGPYGKDYQAALIEGKTAVRQGPKFAARIQALNYIKERIKQGNPPFKGKLGSGQRFQECVAEMETKPGIYDPAGLCASIGRKKYGKKGFQKLGIKNPLNKYFFQLGDGGLVRSTKYGQLDTPMWSGSLTQAKAKARLLVKKFGESITIWRMEPDGDEKAVGMVEAKVGNPSLSYYQESGIASTLGDANDKIGAAKRSTPRELHNEFRSSIRYSSNVDGRGTGGYVWYWALKGKQTNKGFIERGKQFLGLDDESRAKKLSRAFHGRPNRETYEFEEIIDDDRHLAHLGELTELHIRDKKGRVFMITFEDNPVLASTPDANQLVIIGGDQGLDLDDKTVQSGNMFVDGDHARSKRWVPIGEVVRIDYFADKHHLSGPKAQKQGVEYKHEFGEEDGNVPVLMYSPVNERMMLAGGNYRVLDVGIAN